MMLYGTVFQSGTLVIVVAGVMRNNRVFSDLSFTAVWEYGVARACTVFAILHELKIERGWFRCESNKIWNPNDSLCSSNQEKRVV